MSERIFKHNGQTHNKTNLPHKLRRLTKNTLSVSFSWILIRISNKDFVRIPKSPWLSSYSVGVFGSCFAWRVYLRQVDAPGAQGTKSNNSTPYQTNQHDTWSYRTNINVKHDILETCVNTLTSYKSIALRLAISHPSVSHWLWSLLTFETKSFNKGLGIEPYALHLSHPIILLILGVSTLQT